MLLIFCEHPHVQVLEQLVLLALPELPSLMVKESDGSHGWPGRPDGEYVLNESIMKGAKSSCCEEHSSSGIGAAFESLPLVVPQTPDSGGPHEMQVR